MPRQKTERNFCAFCGVKSVKKNSKIFCSNQCFANAQWTSRKTLIKANELSTISDKSIKRFLIEEFGHYCSVCFNKLWNTLPIPLEIDHIDGHSDNRTLTNYRLICPNCHAQTATYKSKNKGNGRHSRRLRYAKGLSY